MSPVKVHLRYSGVGYQLHQTASDALQFSLCDGDKTISLATSADSCLKLQQVRPYCLTLWLMINRPRLFAPLNQT